MPHKSSGSGIYCIKNILNGKVYIGQAYRMERRLYEHRYYLGIGKDKATALQNAVNKYGLDNFEFSVLEYCSPDELNNREIYYIKEFNSNNRNHGYNIAAGGNSGLIGHVFPKWFGEKVSKAKKAQGKKMTPEQREFIIKVNKGKIVSEETRKKMSIANTKENHPMWGRRHSPETIQQYKEMRGGEKAYQFGQKQKSSTSKYFGVCRMISKGHTYWIAYVKVKGVRNHIGSSKDEVEAAQMYDNYIIENGLPNPLNFPEGDRNER